MFNSSNTKNVSFMIALLVVAVVALSYVWVSGTLDSGIYADLTHSVEYED